MIRSLFIFTCVGLVLAGPALAQAAPIRQGVTSQDLASQLDSQTAQIQRTNAELRLQIGDMEREVAELTGKVETLEFLLSQTRDEVNLMQGDDTAIGNAIRAIEDRLEALDRRMTSMNERIANIGTQSGSRELSVSGPADGQQTVIVRNSDGSVTRRIVPSTPSEEDSDGPAYETASDAAVDAPATGTAQPIQTGSLGTISAADLPGEAGPLFAEAKARLLQFNYAGAEEAFSEFLEKFGDDEQAGEAQYWLGEVLYQQEEHAASGQAYTEMIRAYPDDPRSPDALVKLARSMRLVGDTSRACAALDALPTRYPDASGVTRNLAAVERTRSGCDS
ncbi:MAG: tol-pal system protein YbgF [Pseudomonadota bacterium]